MTRTFLRRAHQRRFRRRGWCVVDLFDADEVRELRRDVLALSRRSSGFEDSWEQLDGDYREAIFTLVAGATRDRLATVLDDHRPVAAGLLLKWPDDDSAKSVHQDWSIVDEERHRTVNVWIALDDTTVDNGALRVLPGSHRRFARVRPAPRLPDGVEDPLSGLSIDDLRPVPVRAGQAIVMDMALVHASAPNRTDDLRAAVGIMYAPRAAQLVYTYLMPDGGLEQFDIGDGASFRRMDFRRPPDGFVPLGHLDEWAVQVRRAPVLSG